MPHTGTLLTDEQLPIAPAIQAVHRANGERLRHLIATAIGKNAMSLSMLARETGIDNSHLTRQMNGEAGMRCDFVAAVISHDHLGVIVSGLAAMVGYEAKPRTPDLAAENRRLRDELVRLRDEVNRAIEGTV